MLMPEMSHSGVIVKLFAFTLAMVILPIGSYYVTLEYYWGRRWLTPRHLV